MITNTFDNLTEEIIKVPRNENAKKVDACILTFSHVILKYVLDNYECSKIGDLYSSNGANPIYGFEYEDRYFAVYMSYVGAPGCVADMEDTCALIRTDKYVVFGGAGCLNKEIARGRVMVPTAAYRDEGTSYHYAPPSDYIAVKTSTKPTPEASAFAMYGKDQTAFYSSFARISSSVIRLRYLGAMSNAVLQPFSPSLERR